MGVGGNDGDGVEGAEVVVEGVFVANACDCDCGCCFGVLAEITTLGLYILSATIYPESTLACCATLRLFAGRENESIFSRDREKHSSEVPRSTRS